MLVALKQDGGYVNNISAAGSKSSDAAAGLGLLSIFECNQLNKYLFAILRLLPGALNELGSI
jgi:hypothetical protein